MTLADYVPIVLGRTPIWVWVVLALLITLGIRRLKPRRTRLVVAAIAPVAFAIWSLMGVYAAARSGSAATVLAVWAVSGALGAMSALVHRGPRPAHLGGGVFLFCGTVAPLLIYMGVFWTRYGLAVWAGFQPELAVPLTLAAVAISAATAGRFLADFAPLLLEVRRASGFAADASRTT